MKSPLNKTVAPISFAYHEILVNECFINFQMLFDVKFRRLIQNVKYHTAKQGMDLQIPVFFSNLKL